MRQLSVGIYQTGEMTLGNNSRKTLVVKRPSAPSVDSQQRFIALLIGVVAASLGGLFLAKSEGKLDELPGLLMLIPGAIALRGNIFGAMGSRLGTAVHAGTFRFNLRRDGVVGQNLVATGVLTLFLSVVLAVIGKGTSSLFGIAATMSLAEFIVISTLGGLLASVGVAIITLFLVAGSVRYRWDSDNVTSPLVTAFGDLITVPALLLAADLIDSTTSTNFLAALLAGTAILGVFFIWSSGDYNLQRIAQQSIPVLLIGILIDLAAGVIIEKRITDLLTSKSVLIMLPAFLATAGALGGILSSRLSTQFHLGLDDATPIPSRTSVSDIRSLVVVAIPIFISAAGAAHILGVVTNQNAPGFWQLVLIALFGGALALILVVGVAYYSTMAAFRFGLDPDTYGIPMVTSSLDLVGAFTLVIAMMAVGVT